MQRRAIEDLDRPDRATSSPPPDPGRRTARLRHAAPARGGRRRHPGGATRPQRGAARPARRRAAPGDRGLPEIRRPCLGRATARARHRPRRVLFRGDRAGRAGTAAEVLPELLRAAIVELPWPKSMRFPAASLRWVRPLDRVVACSTARCCRSRSTTCRSATSRAAIAFCRAGGSAVRDFADYRDKLAAAHVVLDAPSAARPHRRRTRPRGARRWARGQARSRLARRGRPASSNGRSC